MLTLLQRLRAAFRPVEPEPAPRTPQEHAAVKCGRDDHALGARLADNPYRDATLQRFWRSGWNDADWLQDQW